MAVKIYKIKFSGRYIGGGALDEGEEYEEIFENEQGKVKKIIRHIPNVVLNGMESHIKEVYNVLEE